MKKGLIIGLVLAVLGCIALAVSVASVGSQLDAARKQVETERNERADLELQVDELTQQRADAMKAQDALKQANADLDAARAERDQLKAKAQEADVAAGKISTLETQLTDAQQRAKSLQSDVESLKAQLAAKSPAPAQPAKP